MPSLKAHKNMSKDRTGFDFEELHKWIDEPQKDLGVNHRIERHSYNTGDEGKIKSYWDKKKGTGWGDKAVCEWLFHIAVDNMETAFKKGFKAYKSNNVFNFFRFGWSLNSKYIFYDFERLDQDELDEEFKDVYYETD